MKYYPQTQRIGIDFPIFTKKMTPEEVKNSRKRLKLSQRQFGEKLGVTLSAVQQWEYGTSKISKPNIITIEYLLKESQNIHVNKHGNKFSETSDGQIIIEVPILPYTAHAKYLEDNNEAGFFDEFDKVTFAVDKLAMGNYLGFKVSGDSMDGGRINDTPDKALVLGRELQRVHWTDGFNESKHGWVLITTKNILFKDIVAFDKENGDITCHSRNESPEYCDFILSLNDVYKIFKIIKRTF